MPIDPLSAGIAGLGSIASSLIGNAGSRRAQESANAYNTKFWNMQNAYNHPVEQMSRLKQAGLNPNMIYGGSPSSATGNADKIAPSKAPDFNFDNPLKDIGAFADYRNKTLVNDNVASQNDNIVQDSLLKHAQTLKLTAEGSSAETKAKIDKMLLQTSVDSQKELLRQTEQRTIGVQIDNLVKSQSAQAKVKQAYYQLKLLKDQITGQQKTNELRKLEIELKAEGIENSGPIIRWLYRQINDPKSKLNELRNEAQFKY